MTDSIYRFSLDIHSTQSQVSISVPQYDTARVIMATLTEGGKPYQLSDDCRAVFSATKADGTTLFNDCIIMNGSVIRYEFTPQTTAAVGIADCSIKIYGANEKILTSPRLTLVVYEGTAYEPSISEDESNIFSGIFQAETERVKAEKERVSAEQVREERITEIAEDVAQAVATANEAKASSGATIWQTTTDLSGRSPIQNTSILTPISGRSPKINDYIVDSAGTWLRIEAILANGEAMSAQVASAHTVYAPSDDSTIWQTTQDYSQHNIGDPIAVLDSILTPISGKTPKANDYVIDTAGNILRISGTGSLTSGSLGLALVKVVSAASSNDTTIWQTTQDYSQFNIGATMVVSDSMLTPISGKTPKANDYVIDTAGNILRISGTSTLTSGSLGFVLTKVVSTAPSNDTTIWQTTLDFSQLNIGSGTGARASSLTSVANKTPEVNDYVIDAVGNILRIGNVSIDESDTSTYVHLIMVSPVPSIVDTGATIWQTTQEYSSMTIGGEMVSENTSILRKIPNRTAKVNDYVIDAVGNTLRVHYVTAGGGLVLEMVSLAAIDKRNITLGLHTDGLIYIFIDGVPTGNGIALPSGASGDVVGNVDSENNIVLLGNLADGTYTVKYEMEDGSTVDIGDLVLDSTPEEPEETNYFNKDTASLNYRIGSSGTLSSYNGIVVSDYITLDSSMVDKNFKVSGVTTVSNSTYKYNCRAAWYDTSGNLIPSALLNYGDNFDNKIKIKSNAVSSYDGTKMRISFVIKDNVALTADDIANIKITLE